ncbi:hypothetical protein [Vagococcus humatus]|uniref:Uncharacterized protein n=1 Tax=Vagococcus humatus TaxID=1889241 RepID=A0A429Z679_9ENTE|nr:hypothetical protein [Vagococcus humatus]RST89212.1 hypothetical protein C7P63_05400 [Vagococcus humatus]
MRKEIKNNPNGYLRAATSIYFDVITEQTACALEVRLKLLDVKDKLELVELIKLLLTQADESEIQKLNKRYNNISKNL